MKPTIATALLAFVFAGTLSTGTAGARGKKPPMPAGIDPGGGNAPFVAGPWAFSLNGLVHGFPDGIGEELRARVEADRRSGIVGDADTEVLFALVLQLLDAGAEPGDALATVVHDVLAITTGRLNLLLTDGGRVFATRVGNSLARRGPLIVSEPIDDDPGWIEVPDRSLVVLARDGVETSPL